MQCEYLDARLGIPAGEHEEITDSTVKLKVFIPPQRLAASRRYTEEVHQDTTIAPLLKHHLRSRLERQRHPVVLPHLNGWRAL